MKKTLLKINPHCKAIFLQTDDYNCFLEIREYLKNINSNITSLNGIPDIFNTGFYIGLVFGVLYLYNGSKLLLCS